MQLVTNYKKLSVPLTCYWYRFARGQQVDSQQISTETTESTNLSINYWSN